MISDIKNICDKYHVHINSNIFMDLDQTIEKIKEMTIRREIFPNDPRKFIAELLKYKQTMEMTALENDFDFQNSIRQILKDKKYFLRDDFIVCNKYIPCLIVQFGSKIWVLDNHKVQVLKDYGFGICEFKIIKNKKIREIYCSGKHPNLNPSTKQFCVDSNFLDSELNYEKLLMVEELLSQCDIGHSYLNKDDRNYILKLING